MHAGIVGAMVGAGVAHLARQWTSAVHAAEWEREWARVGPQWTDRAGNSRVRAQAAGWEFSSRPAGAFVLRGDDVRWQPAVAADRLAIAAATVAVAALLTARAVVRARTTLPLTEPTRRRRGDHHRVDHPLSP
ncbi:hypothetical protein [Pseudonocardia sp. T1-2H]|uniref:hypothetical protein n=1 Tax=Pseudonocardia sp. T1-2H TaxID=3128899 RepID=UPI0031013319